MLRDQSSNGLEDVYRFLRAVAFNWVIGGTDAHPRNYSVLIAPRGHVALAPLYDLASALLLPTRTKVPELPFAMAVAGRRMLGAIDRSAWEAQAKLLRLSPKRVFDEIRDLLERIADGAVETASARASTGIDGGFVELFVARIRARGAVCLKALRSTI